MKSFFLPAFLVGTTLALLKLAVYRGDSRFLDWGPRIPEMSPMWPLLAAATLAIISFLAVWKFSRREAKLKNAAAEPTAATLR
ncbi:MAG: hypothetical protein WC858_01875 [Parcubacteria group bacterium]